jgi:hypothetical protein
MLRESAEWVNAQSEDFGYAPDVPADIVPFELRRFELVEDLAPGGSARARWLKGDDRDYTLSTSDDDQFTVHDPLGVHRGRKKDKYTGSHAQGSRGLAWKPHDHDAWEILTLQPHALMVRGVTSAAVQSTDATFEITSASLKVMQPIGGLICDQDPGENLTVQNDLDWDIDSGGLVFAAWDEDAEEWIAIQAACPA